MFTSGWDGIYCLTYIVISVDMCYIGVQILRGVLVGGPICHRHELGAGNTEVEAICSSFHIVPVT